MEVVKIYLAGAMGGLSLEEQLKWRKQIVDAVKFSNYDYNKIGMFFSPPEYYCQDERADEELKILEREAMIFDLDKLRKSDLVIANFENFSIGTTMEVAIAYENKIPIIGLNRQWDKTIHTWLKECCIKVFDNLKDLVEYLCNFYLN